MASIDFSFHAHGKVLLTAEYFVLDGALALALPTRMGQHLQIAQATDLHGLLHWKSLDQHREAWFEGQFQLPSGTYLRGTDEPTGRQLQQLFSGISRQRTDFWQQWKGLYLESQLDFPREWGLGSSSTLIANLAAWAAVDPFLLSDASFGGSGYDIACATAQGPILYQRLQGKPHFVQFPFHPPFSDNLFFVYLGRKQNSREGIARYRKSKPQPPEIIRKASELTAAFLQAKTLGEFEQLIEEHETLVADTLGFDRAQTRYFPDYWGQVKSLGAWGGDFILATSNRSETATKNFFKEKGFTVMLTYNELAL